MALPDLSRLPLLGTPPVATDTVAGVVAASQQNVRWAASNFIAGGSGFAPVINVKDFGALGDGFHDDTPNIQSALDAAYGPVSAPHGSTSARFTNRPVYFPAGQYKVTAPLYMKAVQGGWIFGAGANSTRIFWGTGTFPGNTMVPPAAVLPPWPSPDTITPIFAINGFAYSKFEGLNLAIGNATHSTAAIYIYADTTTQTTASAFNDLLIQGISGATNYNFGILVGYGATGQCDLSCFRNCTMNLVDYGIEVLSPNAVGNLVISGGGSDCKTALYQVDQGQIDAFVGASMSGNSMDFMLANNSPASIIGCRSESMNCIRAGGNVSGPTSLTVNGLVYQPTFPIQGHPSQTTGCAVNAAQGCVVLQGCSFSPGFTGTPTGYQIVDFGIQPGTVVMDGCFAVTVAPPPFQGVITGSHVDARLYVRGGRFDNPALLSGGGALAYLAFGGTVAQYDVAAPNTGTPGTTFTVAALPAAAAYYKGVRRSVTDSFIAATGNFATNISGHGGGANTVPVFCDGTNWLIG